jgi:hypothetical protein
MESGGYQGEHIFDIHLHGLKVTVYAVSEDISNHTKSLPSRIGESVLYLDSDPTDLTIHLFVLFCEGMEFRCFLGREKIFECHEGTISISKEIFEFFYFHISGDRTVVLLPFVCFGEEENLFFLGGDNPVFNRVGFLLSGVGFLLDFVFLRALYFAFAPIEEELFEIRIFSDEILNRSYPSLWEDNLSSKGFLKEWKVLHHPIMSSSFTRTIPEEPHHLEREIEAYIREYEEELFSARCKESLSSSSEGTILSGFSIPSLDQKLFHYLSESGNEILEVSD